MSTGPELLAYETPPQQPAGPVRARLGVAILGCAVLVLTGWALTISVADAAVQLLEHKGNDELWAFTLFAPIGAGLLWLGIMLFRATHRAARGVPAKGVWKYWERWLCSER